jgi:hypothetical protein
MSCMNDMYIINKWEKFKLSYKGPPDQCLNAFEKYRVKNTSLHRLPKELYLNVCVFLNMSDIVILTTFCKEFMKYYSNIWGIIQDNSFPKSLIQKTNYLSIRNSIALKIWTNVLYYNCFYTSNAYKKISDDETFIIKRSNDLTQLNDMYDTHKGCMNVKKVHLGEISATKKTRDLEYNKLTPTVSSLLHDFKFCSKTDFTGEKYLTIKPDIDMRIFGFDPTTKDGKKNAKECYKWITCMFNGEPDYEYDNNDYEDHDIYIYAYNMENGHYRCRKMPEWYNNVFTNQL